MKLVFVILLSIFSSNTFGQSNALDSIGDFQPMIDYFTKMGFYKNNEIVEAHYMSYHSFKLEFAKQSLGLKEKEIILKSPSKKDVYPISYSVIYDNHLISLFAQGNFVCHNLNDFSRNKSLEYDLNIGHFIYHWCLDNQLYGLSVDRILYQFTGKIWLKSDLRFPLKNQPIYHFDDDFIVYGDCNGEFGGTVYFKDRNTRQTYMTDATCLNTVSKTDSGYLIVASLGHLGGSFTFKHIDDPKQLMSINKLRASKSLFAKIFNNSTEAIGYSDTSMHSKEIFNHMNAEVLAHFTIKGQDYSIISWLDLTFLGQVSKDQIIIIDPLFNDDTYSFSPITQVYNQKTLVNLTKSFYINEWSHKTKDQEASMLLFNENEVYKLYWNKKD